MATVARSQVVQPGDTVNLRAKFRGPDGELTNLDSFPEITIIQPSGGVAVGPTSAGVYRLAVGTYGFDYEIGLFPPIGIWVDTWTGILDGFTVRGEFTFQVNTTQLPAINSDGYAHLGDDPGFCYSQTAICNINHLLKSLRARLNSSGKHRTTDEYGNVVYKDCDIYSTDDLVSFLAQALSMFNETPMFTLFTFDDTPIIEQFHDILVQGATLIALSSQALIERGREWTVNDNGIGFTPPTVSEMLSTQWSAELSNWTERLKYIKMNMRSSAIGLGTLRFPGTSPTFRFMRMFRERQMY